MPAVTGLGAELKATERSAGRVAVETARENSEVLPDRVGRRGSDEIGALDARRTAY